MTEERKEQLRQYRRKYREEHREQDREYRRIWQRNNRDKCNRYIQAWRHSHPEAVAVINKRYREKRKRSQQEHE